MPRKRTRDEMEAEPEEKKQEPSLLQRIRNMWEFASVMQFIYTFGTKAIKIDEDFDIDDFENECLKPGHSEKLEEIGLTLLKWISSHRGLNYDIWDEYTRRQYLAKTPHLNPYGDEEEPKRFRDFDIFTKIRVLHQLTIFAVWNGEKIREKMNSSDTEQMDWRVEEFGYDRDDRNYYLLDDQRLYRRTEPPLPPAPKAKPKASSKKAMAARRRESKRRKLDTEDVEGEEENEDNNDETVLVVEPTEKEVDPSRIDTLGGFKWECLCINLPDYQAFCDSLQKSKDPNEKALRKRLVDLVIPNIEEHEARRRRKIERRERELMVMEKMAGAKRSSRLADKQDQERRVAEQAEAEKKKQADLIAARRDQERQEKMEQDRQSRMMTREQRIKDREYKRILKEEELARDALEQQRIEEGQARGSDRALKQRIEKNKKELEDLEAEEDWTFDCSGCGKYGKNFDDGTHIISCERCNVWQHSKCLGISKAAAEKDNFHFVCKDCRQKEEDAKRPKISLKFRVGASSSPAPPSPAPAQSAFVAVEVPKQQSSRPPSQGAMSNGHLHGQSPQSGSPPQRSLFSPSQLPHGSPRPAYYGNQRAPPYAAFQPQASNMSNGQARSPPPPALVNSSPSHQDQMRSHFSNLSTNQRPLAPSPMPKHPASTPSTLPNNGRLPSPVFNRPTMSPTQGNMDVGPVAGVPQKSSQSPHHQTNGMAVSMNGIHANPHATPLAQHQAQYLHQTPISRTPNYPLSGLSPKKQQTPGPIPTPGVNTPKLNSMSPPSLSADQSRPSSGDTSTPSPNLNASFSAERRTVRGTPIFPPVENLRPSPEQMRHMSSNEPVPTPSKQVQPHPQPLFQASSQDQRQPQQTVGQQPQSLNMLESTSHPTARDVSMQDVQ